MIKLRVNQEKPVEIGTNYFLKDNKIPALMVEPVAFGKSIVIAHIANNIKHKGKTLCLQPSKELLEQNYNKFVALGGQASIFSASMNQKEFGDVTYATIGSIQKIGEQFKEKGYKYLIVDEADRYPREKSSMFSKFMKSSGIKSVLGFTATPFKLQTNTDITGNRFSQLKMLTSRNKYGTFFKDIIHVTQIKDIIKDKFWTLLKYEEYDFNTGELIFNTSKSEFTEESILKAYEDQDISNRIIEKTENLLKEGRKSILIFVPSVAAAQALGDNIKESVVIWGEMPKKAREIAINSFKNGDSKVAINVNVLSIGFDDPTIDCIILGRPTASLSLSYQQIGRGTRIYENKENCLIVDFVGNIKKFGKIEDLLFVNKNKWTLFGSDNRLLSDIPINLIGELTEDINLNDYLKDKQLKEISKSTNVKITFGKFNGKMVHETPIWWRDWALENLNPGPSTYAILAEIVKLKS